MGLEDVVPGVREALDAYDQEEKQSTKIPAVYALFNVETSETLYVGETANLFQRITDHHLGPNEGDLRRRIENDSELDMEVQDGEMWGNTELKWMKVEGGRAKRRRIERAIENRLEPRYPSD
ncbi:GIY-YIG nuclease family protein [Natrinema sp. LN54]|uniref:GIY-YIG nuclease family protein n=1 Tax=Natrinema sp. LN54 TaxID=3458705 RepID=UPI0040356400